MNFFILVNDIQQGPFSIDELRLRGITQDTLVWAEGMAQWAPAWQVEALRPLLHATGQQPGPQPSQYAQQFQPAPPPPPKKKKGRGCIVALVAVAVIAFILALTNPGLAEHRKAIAIRIDETSTTIEGIEDPDIKMVANLVTGIGNGLLKGMMQEFVDENLEYHNYIFFSTTTLHNSLLTQDVRCSVGCLGYVYAVDLAKMVKKFLQEQINGNSDKGDDNGGDNYDDDNNIDNDNNNNNDDNAYGNDGTGSSPGTDAGSKVDSLTHRVASGITHHIAKEVKRQVRQGTDSSTASGISNIIDEIVKLIDN